MKFKTGVARRVVVYSAIGFLSFGVLHETGCSGGKNGSNYECNIEHGTVYVTRSELDRQLRLKGDEIDDAARLKEKMGPMSGWELRSYWNIFNGNLWQNIKHVSGDTSKIDMESLRKGYMRDAGIEAIGGLFGIGDAAFAWDRGTTAIEGASFEAGEKKPIRK